MPMQELPEPDILQALRRDKSFREFELRENYFITLRECCKWKVRQAATSLRVVLKFWFAELPIYSNIVTESRYVSGFSKYSLRS